MNSGLVLWILATASGHPFGARFAAHAIEVDVQPHRIHVVYQADVPNPLVGTSTRDPTADPLREMAEELRSGLLLEVDGETVPLVPITAWSHVATKDTQQFTWSMEGALDQGPTSVVVSNGNLPDVAAVYRANVTLGPGLGATSCSLWRMRDGLIALDEANRWRTDERNRTLSVDVRPEVGPLTPVWLALAPTPSTPRQAADAWSPPLPIALRRGVATPESLGALALGTLLGAVLALMALVLYRRRISA